VTDHRTSVDVAHLLRDLVDGRYAAAERVVLVLDNLNTHTPAEAQHLARTLEWHYTPKHGSWLNIAEIEFSVLARQCQDRRIADAAALKDQVALWETKRNHAGTGVRWRFTTADARLKLHRLYPAVPA
jgi:hypothetical protein